MRDDTKHKTISSTELRTYVYDYFLKNTLQDSKKLVDNLMDLFDDEFRKQKKNFLKEHKIDMKLGIKYSVHMLPDAVKLEKIYNEFLEKSPETILKLAKKYQADMKEFKKQSKYTDLIISLRISVIYNLRPPIEHVKKVIEKLKKLNTEDFNAENKKLVISTIKFNERYLKKTTTKKEVKKEEVQN